jgi:hypothetical protein
MTTLKRTAIVFMTAADERQLSLALLEISPNVRFIDGARWPSSSPPTCLSIEYVSSKDVFIWHPDIIPSIVGQPWHDVFQGPMTGIVIRLERCQIQNSFLLSGSMGWASNASSPIAKPMARFASEVWKSLEEISSAKVDWVNPSDGSIIDSATPGFVVGLDAIRWCQEDLSRKLKFRATENYYLPSTEAEIEQDDGSSGDKGQYNQP